MGKTKVRDPIPEFQTLEEIAEFWDTHSTADYHDLTHEVQFDINLRKRTEPVMLLPELRETIQECTEKTLLPRRTRRTQRKT
ncbi:MAG: BrnA antitoxin family protein [Chloroflexi bacterium]|nr:BrnA antitoxin family protein [Chloroflexota bacterium]